MKLSFLLVLFFLVINSVSQSAQDPRGEIPNEQKIPSAKPKNAGQAEAQRAFEKSLSESLRTIADQQKADYEQRRADQKSWWIDPALLSVGLVYTVFAGLQWWEIRRQAAVAVAGIEVARDAAKAAGESAKAVDAQLHVYRPFVIVRKPFLDSTDLGPPIRRRMPTMVHIKIRNYGIGPADINDYFIKTEIFDWAGTDPPLPTYRRDEAYQTLDPIIEAEGERQLIDMPFDIPESDFTEMLNSAKRLAFHGIINYRGGPEKIYWTRFFWWYLPDGQKLVVANTPELNAHI